MTVELDMMIEMRDLQVAMDVNKKAEMGWFDVEFTFYGCCFQKEKSRYFRISENADKIYEFIEKSRINKCITSNIKKITQKHQVPIGMKEYIAQDVKIELAKQLKDAYPIEFFFDMQKYADQAEEQTAVPFLIDLWENEIEGCFNSEKISRYECLLEYMYECCKLTYLQYRQIYDWIVDERKSMENDPVAKDILEKTFYGIAYEKEENSFEYLDNARKEYIYWKKDELERDGDFVSFIYKKKYWYNYSKKLSQIHKMFENDMNLYLTDQF